MLGLSVTCKEKSCRMDTTQASDNNTAASVEGPDHLTNSRPSRVVRGLTILADLLEAGDLSRIEFEKAKTILFRQLADQMKPQNDDQMTLNEVMGRLEHRNRSALLILELLILE